MLLRSDLSRGYSVSLPTFIHVRSDLLIGKYFPDSDPQLQMTEKRAEEFGSYISKNNVSATGKDDSY